MSGPIAPFKERYRRALVNRQLGIGTFSPRLDALGNSVRGLRVFRDLANEFGLHTFECTNHGSTFLRTLI